MKLKFAAAAVALMISQGALAQGQPQACPTLAQLQAVGTTMAWQDPEQGQWWGITPSNSFGTNDNWTFGAGPIASQSQQGVVEAVNQKLATLGDAKGPIEVEVDGNTSYVCIYNNQAQDFIGVTITPPFALDSVTKFLHQQARRK